MLFLTAHKIKQNMNTDLVFDLRIASGWTMNRMLYYGKDEFEFAILKTSELIVSTISFDLLRAIAAFENERPLPPNFLPLYFSPGYNTETKHVGADIATSKLFSSIQNSHFDNLQLVLRFASPPKSKGVIYVTQIKCDNGNNTVSQIVVIESAK